jgi:hypothetical protein
MSQGGSISGGSSAAGCRREAPGVGAGVGERVAPPHGGERPRPQRENPASRQTRQPPGDRRRSYPGEGAASAAAPGPPRCPYARPRAWPPGMPTGPPASWGIQRLSPSSRDREAARRSRSRRIPRCMRATWRRCSGVRAERSSRLTGVGSAGASSRRYRDARVG